MTFRSVFSVASVFSGLVLAFSPAGGQPPSAIYRSVLRIEVATQVPDLRSPWNSGHFGGGVGTGFIIGKNRILTNAHVVSHGQRILLSTPDHPRKYQARVAAIAHDCDLALLEMDDFDDFAEFPPFSIGGIPGLESEVRVLGYPVGGDRISVTRGVVSRIDFQPYAHSNADSHLVIQIDAAINPGNSGGPVVQGDKVVGVAFQALSSADNTGYIIPVPVIERFLRDIADGTYDHYAEFGASDFHLENPAMREALGLPQDDSGVLITNVVPTSTTDGALEAGDVLLAIDGRPVDSTGMVVIDEETVSFHEIIERKLTGEKIRLRFLRKGEMCEAEVTLKPLHPARMYAFDYESRPRYIVFAGLVFQPLDTNLYLGARLSDVNVRRLYADYSGKGLFRERKDIVVLSRVESDPVTSQLKGFAGKAVDKINGVAVKSLRHAHELLYPENPPEFHLIELFGAPRPVVIPAAEVEGANQRVSRNGGISRLHNLDS